MARVNLSFFKVLELPVDPQPDAIYYILDEDNNIAEWYVTTSEGVAIPASDPATVQNLIQGTLNTTTLLSHLDEDITYNNTATLTNTPLSVTVEAGGIYDIELIVHSTSGAGTSLKFDFGGTATATNFIGEWQAIIATDPTTAVGARVTAAGTDFNAGPVDNNDAYFTFRGTIEVNAAGTLLIRGAQRSAAAVNTTIIQGSILKLTKLNPSGIVIPESDAVAVSALIEEGITEAIDAYSAEQPKVYRALLSQSGTGAPEPVVLENTLGGTVVWTREDVGNYVGTLVGAFPPLKTFIKNPLFYVSEPHVENVFCSMSGSLTSNTINIFITNLFSNQHEDNWLNGTPIEILVYR